MIRLRAPAMQPPGSGTDSKDGHAGHSQSEDRFERLCPKLGCNFAMLRHCALYAIANPGSRDGDLECLAIGQGTVSAAIVGLRRDSLYNEVPHGASHPFLCRCGL